MIAVAEISPRWPVTVNDDAPVTCADAPRRAVRERIHKQYRIARVQVDLNSSDQIIE